MTNDELQALVTALIAAQSMLLASVLRPFITNGVIAATDLEESLDLTERAALERRTQETPVLTALIDLLRRDLGLGKGTRPSAS